MGICKEFFYCQRNILELYNTIFHQAYHSKVHLKMFHNTSSLNPQLLAEVFPEFEKMFEMFFGYLVLDIFCKISFSLGSYFLFACNPGWISVIN